MRNVPAIDQATAACSEGKDVPPCQNWPLPLSLIGRCRRVAYFSASTTTKLSIADSPLKKAGFALVLVVCRESEQIDARRRLRHRVHAVIGNVAVAEQRVRIVRKMAATSLSVANSSGSESAQRNQPCRIGQTHFRGTRPHADLIMQNRRGKVSNLVFGSVRGLRIRPELAAVGSRLRLLVATSERDCAIAVRDWRRLRHGPTARMRTPCSPENTSFSPT